MAMTLDAVVLARAQFAFTMAFHIVFPAFSIGLASYLAVLEGLWLKTKRQHYLDLYKYWLKIFAIAFAMGVVSGIVMSYQFGTNWSVFSDKAGPVIGPLMAYEVMSAFFLEAGFLGVMLFGLERVGKKLHFAAKIAVAAGTFASAFWILSVNSWMQTPAGYAVNAAGQWAWDLAFFGGSVIAAFSQGVILGAILQGVEVTGRAYSGGWWDWLSPFSLLCGASVVIGYALLGATWLNMKTEGDIQARARGLAWWLAAGTLGAILAVSLVTPTLDAGYFQRWFALPGVSITAQVPLLTAIVAVFLFLTLKARRDYWPSCCRWHSSD